MLTATHHRADPNAELAGLGESVAPAPPLDPVGAALDWLRRRRATTRRALLRRVVEAEHAARTDSLTGLYNRDGFTRAADQVLNYAHRAGRPVAAFFVDLDGFHDLNNSLGHATGDALLAETGRILSFVMRGYGPVARFGGDEFVGLLMPPTTLPTFDRTAWRLVAEFHNRLAETTNDRYGIPIHASTGIALAHPYARPTVLPRLLSAADAAMYVAKEPGSTGISTYPAGAPLPRVDNQPAVRTRDRTPAGRLVAPANWSGQ